jgi:hypothetical protein
LIAATVAARANTQPCASAWSGTWRNSGSHT